MRRLMLLRHAKSDWPGAIADVDRPLARRGLYAAPLMGRYMKAEGLVPDAVLVSTARRTRETWGLVSEALQGDDEAGEVDVRFEPRIYEAYPEHLLALVRATDHGVRTLLIIGHNPGLEELASDLAGEGNLTAMQRMRAKYPTSGLAVLDFDAERWEQIAARGGRLERFVTPALIGHGPDE